MRSCLGILRLGTRYSGEQLEAACVRAMAAGASSSGFVEHLLKSGQPLTETVPDDGLGDHRQRSRALLTTTDDRRGRSSNKDKPCTSPTIEKLHALRLGAMANALTAQLQQPDIDAMPFAERLGLLVDIQHSTMLTAALQQRLTRAGMRQTACMENLDLRTPRGLDRSTMQTLAGGLWIRQHRNVLISGAAGIGEKLDCVRVGQSGSPWWRLCALQAAIAVARRIGSGAAERPSGAAPQDPGPHAPPYLGRLGYWRN